MPQNIQVAFQGGGARFCALLAVVEALQELEQSNIIEVDAVSGTSSGSLAGFILAANIDASKVREYLKGEKGRLYLKQTNGIDLSLINMLKIWRGNPIVPITILEDFVDYLIELSKPKCNKFEELTSKNFHVTATDINSDSVLVQNKGFIKHALVNSCALPFVFRNINSNNSSFLDGGLCENLPVDVLKNNSEQYNNIFGVSFRRTAPPTPSTLKEYALSLITAIISNAEERAVEKLGTNRTLKIDCPFTTFQFSEAINSGLHEYYDITKIKAVEWFKEQLDKTNEISVENNEPDFIASQAMKNLTEYYSKTFEPMECSIEKEGLLVYATTLQGGETDSIEQILWLKAGAEIVYAHKIEFEFSGKPSENWVSAYTRDADSSLRGQVTLVPIGSKPIDGSVTKKSLICFFDPPLNPEEKVKLVIQDRILCAFPNLNNGKKEWLGLNIEQTVEKVAVAVCVPEEAVSTIQIGTCQESDCGGIVLTQENVDEDFFQHKPDATWKWLAMRAEKTLTKDKYFAMSLAKINI